VDLLPAERATEWVRLAAKPAERNRRG